MEAKHWCWIQLDDDCVDPTWHKCYRGDTVTIGKDELLRVEIDPPFLPQYAGNAYQFPDVAPLKPGVPYNIPLIGLRVDSVAGKLPGRLIPVPPDYREGRIELWVVHDLNVLDVREGIGMRAILARKCGPFDTLLR